MTQTELVPMEVREVRDTIAQLEDEALGLMRMLYPAMDALSQASLAQVRKALHAKAIEVFELVVSQLLHTPIEPRRVEGLTVTAMYLLVDAGFGALRRAHLH